MEYDPQTLELLTRVFDAMWKDVDTPKMSLLEQAALRVRLKQHLLEAAETGKTDPDLLRDCAETDARSPAGRVRGVCCLTEDTDPAGRSRLRSGQGRLSGKAV